MRLSLPAVTLMTMLPLWACDRGERTGAGKARPAVAPARLSPVALLPPLVNRAVTRRVEVRNPLSVPATQVDLFRQSEGKADILWVIDDTGSMEDERQRLGGNFQRFLQALLSVHTDFQMGVTSTNPRDKGALRGATKIVTNFTPNPEAAFLADSTFPDSRFRWSQGLRMAQLALTDRVADGTNAGFLRAGAALAVIVVSDADDGSYGDSSHYARFLRGVKGRGNENLVSFSTIAGTTPNGCYGPGAQSYLGGLAKPAFRYASVSSKTGGVVGSLCETSFEDTLLRIAEALNTLRRVFPLSLKPDSATLSVRVNGALIPNDVVNGWQYQEATRSLAFLGNYVPPPNATIQLQYALSP